MTFATPLIAAILAGIVIPSLIILYFLKLRRRDMEVSSTLLWKKAIQDLQANAPFQKLRNNILLILQLLALIAALFAIAQPELRHRGVSTARRIILIDRSASMNATDGDAKPAEPASPAPVAGGDAPAAGSGTDASDPKSNRTTRLEAAKKQALELVASLREPTLFDDKAEEAMVIAFDSSAAVVQSFTPNKAMLKEAIEGIQPTDAPSSLERAYDLARAYTGTKKFEDQVKETVNGKPAGFIPSGPTATLHIYSDGRLSDAEKIQTAPEDTVVYHPLGAPDAPNVGITGLRAERSFDNPGRVNIFVGLQSTDMAAREIDAELTIDGAAQAVKGVRVPAATQPIGQDEAKTVTAPNPDGTPGAAPANPRRIPGLGGFVFPLDRMEGGTAVVRLLLTERDALPTDNVAYLSIPPAKRLSVALVTTGNLFIKSALDGLNLSKFDVKSPEDFQKMLDGGLTAQYDVFIFDRVLPEVALGDKKRGPGLPPGRSLVLGAVPPPPLGLVDLGPGEGDVILSYERDHPALHLAALDKISISKLRRVQIAPDTPVREIAKSKGGPAIVEVNDATLEAIVVPWDVADSDWPFDPGWVLFLAGSVLHLSETQSGALSEGIRAGDTLTTRLPPGSQGVRLTEPDGTSIKLDAAPDGSVAYGPVMRLGMYTVAWEGQATPIDVADGSTARRRIAANLLDPYESDLGTTPSLAMARGEIKGQRERESDLTRKLWPYLLLFTLGVVMFEWFVYNRKVAV
jgi:hypothetical protein